MRPHQGGGQSPPREVSIIEREGKPTVAASPEGMLKREGVRELQQALRDHDLPVPVDGRYGNKTREAVLAFQRQQGLAPTSMPDLETLDQLGLDPIKLYQNLGG